MELKKNPKKDLNKNRGLYFVTGLALIMLLTYVALEWKFYDEKPDYLTVLNITPELIEEVLPIIEIKLPPPPPVIPEIIEVIPDDDDTIETPIESTEPDPNEPVLEVDDIEVVEIDEPDEIPFIVIEDVPIFPGCEQEKGADAMRNCFQKMMSKHIVKNFRYPEIEREMGIQGRVSVVFVIQKDGSIGNVRMRGPNKNLEKEAARIIDKLPKMTPGKQRGKAVRVPFSIPINFKLQ